MKVIGIIAEYNPFHLGHKYQIDKIKELYKDSIIICLCSSTFTQRGEVSIINKWDKAKIALDNNIDLFIEFPFCYATQSADIFAKGAIDILNKLKIDILVFGTESIEADDLIKLANIEINNKEFNNIVKSYLNKGINYPTALNNALKDIANINISKPNDLLGLSYVKEIIKNNYNITPITIKRIDNYHNSKVINNIASASYIRNRLYHNLDIKKYIPNYDVNYIKNININYFYNYLKYNIISNINNLDKFLDVDEGIENRIKKYINKSNNWEELVMNIKTKRYTYNRINRMLLHILTSFTKEENNNIKIDYIKVLGFNNKGQSHLNKIKKDIKIITNYKPNISLLLDIEYRITNIYSLILNNDLILDEIRHKPIIKENTK